VFVVDSFERDESTRNINIALIIDPHQLGGILLSYASSLVNMKPLTYILFLFCSCLPYASAFSIRSFSFAPNGVCVSPLYFVTQEQKFTMKNVPGKGDCMFLAVALASLCSVGLGANDVLLNSISSETRNVVADILENPSGTLVIEGTRLVSTSSLLKSAAKTEGVSASKYIDRLRGGSLRGGGPELTVLSNILRRPISIYELSSNDESDDNKFTQAIQCMGTFGESLFADPLVKVPDSAILNNNGSMPGAYSWHLHILVVDTSMPDEKHACVLLPQSS
jgi:hypothetical protein